MEIILINKWNISNNICNIFRNMSEFYLKIVNKLYKYITFITIIFMPTRVSTNDDNSDILHLAYYQEQRVLFSKLCVEECILLLKEGEY